MAEKLSAKQAAIQMGTDARTLRKFLRSDACPMDPVGQGNRYEFTAGEVKKLKKLFLAWSGGTKKTKAEKVIEHDPAEDEDIEEIDLEDEDLAPKDEDEELDLDDLEGPDDEELEDLEIEELD